MPEGFTNVTEGSGKKLHTFELTIGANTVQDEIVRLGDQYQASYIIDQGSTSVATANDHTIQVMAGGSLNVYIRRIRIFQMVLATTAALATIEIIRLTTAGTGGTSNAVDKLDDTDAGAGATAMALPTAKGTEGTRLMRFSVPYIQTVPTGGFSPLMFDHIFGEGKAKPLRIPAGTTNGICIKHVTAVAGASVGCIIELTETNY